MPTCTDTTRRTDNTTTPRIIHYANATLDGALCGAQVLGVYVQGHTVDCVVCADLKAQHDNTPPRNTLTRLLHRLFKNQPPR